MENKTGLKDISVACAKLRAAVIMCISQHRATVDVAR